MLATGVLVFVILAAQYVVLSKASVAYGIAPKGLISSSAGSAMIDPYTLSSFALGLLFGKALRGMTSFNTGMALTTAGAVALPKALSLFNLSGQATLAKIDKTLTNATFDAAAAISGYMLAPRLSWTVVLGLIVACEALTFYFRGDNATLNAIDLVAPMGIKKTIMTWRLKRVPYDDYEILLASGAGGMVQPDLPMKMTAAECACPENFEFYENNVCMGYITDGKETRDTMISCNQPVTRWAPGVKTVPKSDWPKKK